MNRLTVGYIIGAQVLGADVAHADKATVRTVQQKLHALSLATGNSAFDPYHDKYRDDGVIGSKTKSAVAAFNRAYGWPDDGESITDGTLEALKRSDVVNPSSAQSAPTPTPQPSASQPVSTTVPPVERATVFSPRYSVIDSQAAMDALVQDATPRNPMMLQRERGRAADAASASPWGKIAFGIVAAVSLGGVAYLLATGRGKKSASRGVAYAQTLPGLRRAR